MQMPGLDMVSILVSRSLMYVQLLILIGAMCVLFCHDAVCFSFGAHYDVSVMMLLPYQTIK